jgi:hypothetical protein
MTGMVVMLLPQVLSTGAHSLRALYRWNMYAVQA